MTKTNTLTPKPNGTASLPAELREIYDLLAAYGRKVRLAAEGPGQLRVAVLVAPGFQFAERGYHALLEV